MNITITGLDQLESIVEDLKTDLMSLDNYLSNEVDEDLRAIIAGNFEQIWATKGSAIGEDWNGRTLVDTGALRNSLTNPGELMVTVQNGLITFGSNVSYAPYVNAMYTFEGLTPEAVSQIDNLVYNFLIRRTRGNWS